MMRAGDRLFKPQRRVVFLSDRINYSDACPSENNIPCRCVSHVFACMCWASHTILFLLCIPCFHRHRVAWSTVTALVPGRISLTTHTAMIVMTICLETQLPEKKDAGVCTHKLLIYLLLVKDLWSCNFRLKKTNQLAPEMKNVEPSYFYF